MTRSGNSRIKEPREKAASRVIINQKQALRQWPIPTKKRKSKRIGQITVKCSTKVKAREPGLF